MSRGCNSNSTIPTLVFIHGWGNNATVWDACLPYLPGKHECWALPGFGDDNAQQSIVHLDQYIEFCIASLPESCILIGWSLGGMLATRLAQLAPNKVQGLITFATNANFVASDDWPNAMPTETFTAFLEQFSASPEKVFSRFCLLQTKGDANAKRVLSQLKSNIPAPENVAQWREALSWLSALNNTRAIQNIKQPQWHVFAEHDALVPVDAAESTQHLLSINAGANVNNKEGSAVKTVAGASHSLLLTHAQECSRLINEFLQPWVGINKQKIAESFSGAATTYDSAAKVQQAVGKALLQRIQNPLNGVWLDAGCGTAFLQRHLSAQLAPSYWVNGDIAFGMLNASKNASHINQPVPGKSASWIGLDVEQLPFKANSLNGVISSLTLQWVRNLNTALAQCYNALKPGGECWVATLTSDTLHELKSAWLAVDDFTHVNAFLSAQAVQNTFQQVGFKLLETHEQAFTDEYPSLMPLLKSLKAIGAHNMNAGQKPGLTTRHQLNLLEQAYETFRNQNRQLPVTYQVLFVRAKKHE